MTSKTERRGRPAGVSNGSTAGEIAAYIAAHEGAVSVREISEGLGLAKVSVYHHLRTLTTKGLTDGERKGRHTLYRATPLMDSIYSWAQHG